MQEALAGLQESGGEGFVGYCRVWRGVERGGEGVGRVRVLGELSLGCYALAWLLGVEPASKIGRRSCQPCRAQCGTGA